MMATMKSSRHRLVKASPPDKTGGKKKEWQDEPDHNKWIDEGEQANLFPEPEKPKHQVQQKSQPRTKIKVEQQDLFAESNAGKDQEEGESEKVTDDHDTDSLEESKTPPKDDKSYGVGRNH
jgi:hypothetical protein